jgi:WD domain, G-beta repeat
VVSLASDPNSAHGLVSGSHDGTCRIWDIRSIKPGSGSSLETGGQIGESVYVIPRRGNEEKRPVAGEGVKVFDVQWDKGVGIVSASEDKRVQINRAE